VTCFHETIWVKRDTADEPIRVGLGTYHKKQIGGGMHRLNAVLSRANYLKTLFTDQAGDLRAKVECDPRRVYDASHEVVGHRCRKPRAAHKYVDMSGLAGKKHSSLARGITPANDNRVASPAEATLSEVAA
jgi:hypothetical protein